MARPWWIVALLVASTILAGCLGPRDLSGDTVEAAPAPMANPLDAGPLQFDVLLYDFGEAVVNGGPVNGQAYPIPVRGQIHVPKGDGPFPVVLLMHGRHGTCETPVSEILLPRCPSAAPIVTPVDSYLGYVYLADHLASHGFVVASIDANEINSVDGTTVGLGGDAGMNMRGELVIATLDGLKDRNESAVPTPSGDGVGGALVGRLDLTRIGLMGHSRGGEGVVTALPFNNGYGIRAVFALAPTAFVPRPIDNVAFATILPYCDGDVHTLHGARFFDDARTHAGRNDLYQYYVSGANHNWFNTIWTGDDASFRMADDPFCGTEGSGRLSMDEQEAIGLAYMGSFFLYHVGGMTEFAPFVRGAGFPPGTCHIDGGCQREVLTSWYPRGDLLVIEDGAGSTTTNDAGGSIRTTGNVALTSCTIADCDIDGLVGRADRFVLDASGRVTLTAEIPEGSLAGDGVRVMFRGASASPVMVAISASDRDGDVMGDTLLLMPPPGDEDIQRYVLNEIGVEFAGLAPSGVRAVTLMFSGEGAYQVQIADLALHAGP